MTFDPSDGAREVDWTIDVGISQERVPPSAELASAADELKALEGALIRVVEKFHGIEEAMRLVAAEGFPVPQIVEQTMLGADTVARVLEGGTIINWPQGTWT